MFIPTHITESKIHHRLSQLIVALIEDEDIGGGSERKLGRMTAISGNGLGLWTDLKADPRLLKLTQFAYHLGWSMSELMTFVEGDEDPQEAISRKKKVVPSQQTVKRKRKKATSTSKDKSLFVKDLLPERLSRERLKMLLLDTMALQGITESEIFMKTAIEGNLLRVILDVDLTFKFGRSPFERLAPFVYQVDKWEQLRPFFKKPHLTYRNYTDDLIADLQLQSKVSELAEVS